MKRFVWIAWISLSFVTVGCHSVRSHCNDTRTDVRNCILAHNAWTDYSECVEARPHYHDFGKGYKAGYRDVLEGGKGCQPALPPECYWGPCYETVEGRQQINAWFEGYSQGALTAQQHGLANLQKLPISPAMRATLASARTMHPISDQDIGIRLSRPDVVSDPEAEVAPQADIPSLPQVHSGDAAAEAAAADAAAVDAAPVDGTVDATAGPGRAYQD